MKKTCQSAADALFANTSKACKELHKAAKKRLREKARRDWWAANGNKKKS